MSRKSHCVLFVVNVTLLAIVLVQVSTDAGRLVSLDRVIESGDWKYRFSEWYEIAKALESLGQRGLITVIAVLVTFGIAYSRRTVRPVIVLAATLLAVNLVVGFAKLGFGRDKPRYGETEILQGGIIFPSGHAANVVLIWGILAYLLVRYGRRPPRLVVLVAIVAAVSVGMGAASLYLNTHWLTDILAGWLAGALVLHGAVAGDAALADLSVDAVVARMVRPIRRHSRQVATAAAAKHLMNGNVVEPWRRPSTPGACAFRPPVNPRTHRRELARSR